jgi:phosphoserine phosphatase
MYVATLLSNPTEPVLGIENVLPYHRQLKGGEFRWLKDRVACEFPIPAIEPGHRKIWNSLQDRGIDLVIQKAKGRRKKILLADMDSTMIGQECIDELADEAGFGPQVAEITAQAMNGLIEFDGALRKRVALLKGLSETVIDDVLEKRITPTAGAKLLLATMRGNDGYSALVSGGFTDFTQAVAAGLGFDENRANVLGIEDGKLTGEVVGPILGRQAKIDALNEICAARGLLPEDVIAVGDGANDLGMLKLAGTGVALHAKPAVQKQAEVVINHGDLTALLYIQGYAWTDFVKL